MTRKIVLFISFIYLAFVLSLIFSPDANAQKKQETITQINTSSPIFDFIYGGETEEFGGVRIQIHDRKHQFVSMNYDRLTDQSKGNDPKNPWIKLHQMPEIDLLAFRQSESLEEAAVQVDGITVIAVRLNKLREAALIWYK